MDAALLSSKTSAFKELCFIENIYKSREQLRAKLRDHGFKIYTELDVPKVDCFVYLPTGFPTTHDEAESIDFKSHSGARVTVGVCIGGTCLSNGWDEKVNLGLQGILKINKNCSSADKTATTIFLALDDLCREFPELAEHDIRLDVQISGYSLGGLFAQVTTVLLQDWANSTGHTVTCRTYESPGTPEMYHDIAENYAPDAGSFWKKRITNYKSLPNPLNSVFRNIGSVFHLKNTDHISCDAAWVIQCLAGTAKRLTFWTSLLRGFGLTVPDGGFDSLSTHEKRLVIAATMATELGMGLPEIVRNHDVSLMLKCFDDVSEEILSRKCIEMEEWPVYEMFEDAAVTWIERMSRGLVLMNPRNAGIHTLFLFGGKRGFVERKLAEIPGYRPLSKTAPQAVDKTD